VSASGDGAALNVVFTVLTTITKEQRTRIREIEAIIQTATVVYELRPERGL